MSVRRLALLIIVGGALAFTEPAPAQQQGGDQVTRPEAEDVRARFPAVYEAVWSVPTANNAAKEAAIAAIETAVALASSPGTHETLFLPFDLDGSALLTAMMADPAAVAADTLDRLGTNLAEEAVISVGAALIVDHIFAPRTLSELPPEWQMPIRALLTATLEEFAGVARASSDPTALAAPLVNRALDIHAIYKATGALVRVQDRALTAMALSIESAAQLGGQNSPNRARAIASDIMRQASATIPDIVGRDDATAVNEIVNLTFVALMSQNRGDLDRARSLANQILESGRASANIHPFSAVTKPLDWLTAIGRTDFRDTPEQAAIIMVSTTNLRELFASPPPVAIGSGVIREIAANGAGFRHDVTLTWGGKPQGIVGSFVMDGQWEEAGLRLTLRSADGRFNPNARMNPVESGGRMNLLMGASPRQRCDGCKPTESFETAFGLRFENNILSGPHQEMTLLVPDATLERNDLIGVSLRSHDTIYITDTDLDIAALIGQRPVSIEPEVAPDVRHNPVAATEPVVSESTGVWRLIDRPDIELSLGGASGAFEFADNGSAQFAGKAVFPAWTPDSLENTTLKVFLSADGDSALVVFSMPDFGARRMAVVDIRSRLVLNAGVEPTARWGPSARVAWSKDGAYAAMAFPTGEYSSALGVFETATGRFALHEPSTVGDDREAQVLLSSIETRAEETVVAAYEVFGFDDYGLPEAEGIIRTEIDLVALMRPGTGSPAVLPETEPAPNPTVGADLVSALCRGSSQDCDLSEAQVRLVERLIDDYEGDVAMINVVADHADYAVLAWAAYGDEPALARARERGWTPMRNLVVENDGLVGDTVATLFGNAEEESVLAYRGTAGYLHPDWVTNLGALVPGPVFKGQVDAARRLADEAIATNPNVVFVGHSLGGRLAQAARIRTKNPAVAFNMAPLLNSGEGAASEEMPAKFLSFRSPDDPVTELEEGSHFVVVNAVRTNMNLVGDLAASEYTHDVQGLAEAMQAIRAVRDKGWFSATILGGAPPPGPANLPAVSPSLSEASVDGGRVETTGRPGDASSAIGAPLTPAERDYLQRAIQSCWSVPAGRRDGGKRRVAIAAEMTADGRLVNSSIALAEPQASLDANTEELFESGRRSLLRCSPYDGLPKEKFAQWRHLEIIFSSEGVVSW